MSSSRYSGPLFVLNVRFEPRNLYCSGYEMLMTMTITLSNSSILGLPSLLRQCWLGSRKGIWPEQNAGILVMVVLMTGALQVSVMVSSPAPQHILLQ